VTRQPAALALGVLVLCGMLACGGSPAQIVDYSPERGARDIPTIAPIQITFDHNVDQASVASRLHLVPETDGHIEWVNGKKLVYQHATLQPATMYDVVLEAGYRDNLGNAYALRHHWTFTTEPPPAVTASSPADGGTDIDPADYLSIDFSRAMNAASMTSAITFQPSVPFSVRLDPGDPRRAIVAPDELLVPKTTYRMLITTSATDVDGNQLGRVATIDFTTGDARALHHWVAFAAQGVGSAGGGLWIVNPDSGFPRRLLSANLLQAFSWSPEGDRLVAQGGNGAWLTYTPGVGSLALDFQATWAAALAFGLGYAYEQDGSLYHLGSAGGAELIAANVFGAAVSPDGRRVAFIDAGGGSSRIWGYDVALRSRYLINTETGTLSNISWAPSGNRVAYLLTDSTGTSLRVRNLTGNASTTTVAAGQLGAPAWLRDSDRVVFTATVPSPTGAIRRAFLINVVAPPPALTVSLGLPADPTIDISEPVPSPDGHQIAFISSGQVWIMNADGTRPIALTTFDAESFPYSCRMPAWTRS
jgi:Bacterial Ig-like domain/WD40-like Beta Propeller Repeat